MLADAYRFDATLWETRDSDNEIYFEDSYVLNCDPAVEVDDLRLINIIREG